MSIHTDLTRFFSSGPRASLHLQKTVFCAINRRKRYGFGKSSKIVLESACIIASKFGLLPPPLVVLLREFGGGNGGGTGFWNGFGSGDFDGWKRRRNMKLEVMGIIAICCLGLGIVLGKELVVDAEVLLGILGLLLLGLSLNGWRKGAKHWILGFCCCGFLWCLALKKEDFWTMVKCIGTLKKNGRRKRRIF